MLPPPWKFFNQDPSRPQGPRKRALRTIDCHEPPQYSPPGLRRWREVKKSPMYRETLQTTGIYVGRIVIVTREFASFSSPPPDTGSPLWTRQVLGVRFLRHGGIYRSDVMVEGPPPLTAAGLASGVKNHNPNRWERTRGIAPPSTRRVASVKNAREGPRPAHRPR